jgi:hypothetical protein
MPESITVNKLGSSFASDSGDHAIAKIAKTTKMDCQSKKQVQLTIRKL